MEIKRIVPNIYSENLGRSKIFYTQFLDLQLVMDLGWIITLASRSNPMAQINVLSVADNKTPNNNSVFLSIEVPNVDKLYDKAKMTGQNICYEIRDEDWGVRRFFVKDPNGATLNLLSHIGVG